MEKLLSGRKLLYILMAVIGSVLIFSCEYDNEEELYAGFVCDLSDTKYSTTVQPIIAANCYVCHDVDNAADLGSDIVLEGYEALFPWAESGTLYGALNWDECCSNMPYEASKLPECSINQIKQWIDNGAMDN